MYPTVRNIISDFDFSVKYAQICKTKFDLENYHI
jgi:hypothetical protein